MKFLSIHSLAVLLASDELMKTQKVPHTHTHAHRAN